jgi:hypothetical protein
MNDFLLELAPKDPLWLYNTYRGIMNEYPNAGGVAGCLQTFTNLYDGKEETTEFSINLDIKHVGFIPHFDDFVLTLYREGIALAHLLGNEAVIDKMDPKLAQQLQADGIPLDKPLAEKWATWQFQTSNAQDRFDEMAGTSYVVKALELIRAQSALVYLLHSGEIDEQYYSTSIAKMTETMDKLGLNGIDKMLAARPELEEKYAEDTRPIFISQKFTIGVLADHKTLPREVLMANGQMQKGEYFKLMRDACTYPGEKSKLMELMLGEDYPNAFNERAKTLRAYETQGLTSYVLNLEPHELMNRVVRGANEDLQMAAYKALLINYGLGQAHEVVDKLRQGKWNKQSGQNAQAGRQIGPGQSADNSTDASGAENTGDAQKKTGAEPLDDPQEAKAENTPPANPKPQNSNNGPRTPSSGGSNGWTNTSAEETTHKDDSTKKHDNFVIAGKIGSTAVLSILGVFGASKFLKETGSNKPNQQSEPQDNSKKFKYALGIAASLAGIALVWIKGDDIVKGVGNLFNRGVA